MRQIEPNEAQTFLKDLYECKLLKNANESVVNEVGMLYHYYTYTGHIYRLWSSEFIEDTNQPIRYKVSLAENSEIQIRDLDDNNKLLNFDEAQKVMKDNYEMEKIRYDVSSFLQVYLGLSQVRNALNNYFELGKPLETYIELKVTEDELNKSNSNFVKYKDLVETRKKVLEEIRERKQE